MILQLVLDDCRSWLRDTDDESVDVVLCDPPYGLEFLGKEWDKFVPGGVPMMTATERSSHMNRSNSFGPWGRGARPIAPNAHGHRNEKCLYCGKWRVSSNPCTCEDPQWESRFRREAPRAMIALEQWHIAWLIEVHRVLRPGGVIKAFGGTRTFHRFTKAMVRAGFSPIILEAWGYGSGFPKGLLIQEPPWEGWGTALKPAWEPILVGVKP